MKMMHFVYLIVVSLLFVSCKTGSYANIKKIGTLNNDIKAEQICYYDNYVYYVENDKENKVKIYKKSITDGKTEEVQYDEKVNLTKIDKISMNKKWIMLDSRGEKVVVLDKKWKYVVEHISKINPATTTFYTISEKYVYWSSLIYIKNGMYNLITSEFIFADFYNQNEIVADENLPGPLVWDEIDNVLYSSHYSYPKKIIFNDSGFNKIGEINGIGLSREPIQWKDINGKYYPDGYVAVSSIAYDKDNIYVPRTGGFNYSEDKVIPLAYEFGIEVYSKTEKKNIRTLSSKELKKLQGMSYVLGTTETDVVVVVENYNKSKKTSGSEYERSVSLYLIDKK